MLVRVMRATSAACGAPRQSAGRINWSNEPQPAAGKDRNQEHEQHDRDAGDHEVRQGDADRGQRHQRHVGDRAAAHGRRDAGDQPERQRERQRQDAERRRDRQPFGDDAVDGVVAAA